MVTVSVQFAIGGFPNFASLFSQYFRWFFSPQAVTTSIINAEIGAGGQLITSAAAAAPRASVAAQSPGDRELVVSATSSPNAAVHGATPVEKAMAMEVTPSRASLSTRLFDAFQSPVAASPAVVPAEIVEPDAAYGEDIISLVADPSLDSDAGADVAARLNAVDTTLRSVVVSLSGSQRRSTTIVEAEESQKQTSIVVQVKTDVVTRFITSPASVSVHTITHLSSPPLSTIIVSVSPPPTTVTVPVSVTPSVVTVIKEEV